MNGYSNHYRNNQVMTSSPEQLLIMLYDGVIRFVRQAKLAIEDRRQRDKSIALGKAIAIITEFSNTLNYEVGGDIALDLNRLYDFMIRELTAVNARGDVDRLVPIEQVLLDLREGFSGAIEINRGGEKKAEAAVGQVAVSF